MPRYLVEVDAVDDAVRSRAQALTVDRFPEVEVERLVSADGSPTQRERWVCRAPSDTHVRRWATAADLPNPVISEPNPPEQGESA